MDRSYHDKICDWAKYQNQNRQTGRTTRLIKKGLELVREGKTVYVVVFGQMNKEYLKDKYPSLNFITKDYEFRHLANRKHVEVLIDNSVIEILYTRYYYGTMHDEIDNYADSLPHDSMDQEIVRILTEKCSECVKESKHKFLDSDRNFKQFYENQILKYGFDYVGFI